MRGPRFRASGCVAVVVALGACGNSGAVSTNAADGSTPDANSDRAVFDVADVATERPADAAADVQSPEDGAISADVLDEDGPDGESGPMCTPFNQPCTTDIQCCAGTRCCSGEALCPADASGATCLCTTCI